MRKSSGISMTKYKIGHQSRRPGEKDTINLKVQAQYMKNNQAQSLISSSYKRVGGQIKSAIPSRHEGYSMKQSGQIKNNSRNLTQSKNVNKLQIKNDPSIQWSRFTTPSQNKSQTSNTIHSDHQQNKFNHQNQKPSINLGSISAEQIAISSLQRIIVQSSTTYQTGENLFVQEQNKTPATYHQYQMGEQMPNDHHNDSSVGIPILQVKLESVSQLQQEIAESIKKKSQLNEPFSSQFLQQLSSFIDSEYPSFSLKDSEMSKLDLKKLKAQPCKYCAKYELNLSLKAMCQQCFTKFLLGYQLHQINTKKVEKNKEQTQTTPKVPGRLFQRSKY